MVCKSTILFLNTQYQNINFHLNLICELQTTMLFFLQRQFLKSSEKQEQHTNQNTNQIDNFHLQMFIF